MLKKIIFTIFILLNFAQLTFAENLEIRFCESVLPYNGGLLISNFGSKDLQVKPNEQNGYVLYYKNNQLKEFIPKNGTLKTPTAMAVYKNKFYIADGDKIFIYDLKNMSKKPDKLYLMNGAKVVNDIIIDKGMLYATITDKNCVYKVDLKSKNLTPKKWLKIPSPNGIVAYKNTIYIASIPADYTNVRDENVIYVVPNKNNPKLERFNEKSGLYDGLGISKNGKFLYASDWATSSIYEINTTNKKETTVYKKEGLTPADITFKNNKLYIPDMKNFRVIIYNVKNHSEQFL